MFRVQQGHLWGYHHRPEQGLVPRTLCLCFLRDPLDREVKILRCRLEALLQEVLREVSSGVQEASQKEVHRAPHLDQVHLLKTSRNCIQWPVSSSPAAHRIECISLDAHHSGLHFPNPIVLFIIYLIDSPHYSSVHVLQSIDFVHDGRVKPNCANMWLTQLPLLITIRLISASAGSFETFHSAQSFVSESVS